MKSVYDMNRDEFLHELNQVARPSDVYQWASDIYAYMSGLFRENCGDSVLREWAFQWASDGLGIEYDQIYDRWLA